MAQAAADPLAVEFTWMDVLMASEKQTKPQVNTLNPTHMYLFSLRMHTYFNMLKKGRRFSHKFDWHMVLGRA